VRSKPSTKSSTGPIKLVSFAVVTAERRSPIVALLQEAKSGRITACVRMEGQPSALRGGSWPGVLCLCKQALAAYMQMFGSPKWVAAPHCCMVTWSLCVLVWQALHVVDESLCVSGIAAHVGQHHPAGGCTCATVDSVDCSASSTQPAHSWSRLPCSLTPHLTNSAWTDANLMCNTCT
jgi:hypothetical protein